MTEANPMDMAHEKPRAARRRSIRASVALAVLLAAQVAGCSGGAGEPPLFPLNEGWRWTYRMITETGAGISDERFTVENRGRTAYTPTQMAPGRHNSLGNHYYFINDATGVYRIGVRSEIETVVRPDEEPLRRFVLKMPIAQGTTWQSLTKPFLLRHSFNWPNELKYGKPIAMTFEIESTDQTITVPAGRFEHCVVVAGHVVMNLFLDPVTGWNQVPIDQKEWYCPNAGMVRFVRSEPLKTRYLNGGTMSFELTSLEK
jgi:hypothetical protein